VTPLQVAVGVAVGFAAGTLSGLFGVGGGVITQPAAYALLGATPIQAVATPLPVIFPTTVIGAYTYARAGEVSFRAARWGAVPGVAGATLGAYLTAFVNAHVLLLATAVLIAWTAIQVMRGRTPSTPWVKGKTAVWKYAAIAFGAGLASGLLGLGGGIIIVPALTLLIGMPLRRALGTSLLLIAILVVPGTIVHGALGHIDWAIFLVLLAGVLPGARIGATLALGARERTLRLAVGTFLIATALVYAVEQVVSLAQGRG
jgi:uncharacterized membrane protein YfcA